MMYLQILFEIFTYCVDPVHLSLKVIKLLLKPFAPANQFLDLPARAADNDHHKKQAATFSPVGAKKKKSSENFAQHDFLSRRQLRRRFRFLVCDVGRRRRMDWVIAVGGVATGQCRILPSYDIIVVMSILTLHKVLMMMLIQQLSLFVYGVKTST